MPASRCLHLRLIPLLIMLLMTPHAVVALALQTLSSVPSSASASLPLPSTSPSFASPTSTVSKRNYKRRPAMVIVTPLPPSVLNSRLLHHHS